MAQTVSLDETMQEIIAEAIQGGLGANPEDVVKLALQELWGSHLLRGYNADDLRKIGEEIIADTRPGIPADMVFAHLETLCQQMDDEARSIRAA